MSATTRTPELSLPLLTAEEVAELLGGIPAKTVHQYAREGRLPSIEIGGRHRRFNRPCIERAVAEAYAQGRRL